MQNGDILGGKLISWENRFCFDSGQRRKHTGGSDVKFYKMFLSLRVLWSDFKNLH